MKERPSRISDPSHPQFVLIQGKRRIGKTELLLRELDEREGFFFNADETDCIFFLHAPGEPIV